MVQKDKNMLCDYFICAYTYCTMIKIGQSMASICQCAMAQITDNSQTDNSLLPVAMKLQTVKAGNLFFHYIVIS